MAGTTRPVFRITPDSLYGSVTGKHPFHILIKFPRSIQLHPESMPGQPPRCSQAPSTADGSVSQSRQVWGEAQNHPTFVVCPGKEPWFTLALGPGSNVFLHATVFSQRLSCTFCLRRWQNVRRPCRWNRSGADFSTTVLVLSPTPFEPDGRVEISWLYLEEWNLIETAAQWQTQEKRKPTKYQLRNSWLSGREWPGS